MARCCPNLGPGDVYTAIQLFPHSRSGVSDPRESCRWTWPRSTLVLPLHFSILLARGKKDSALWEANEWCHCWAESNLTPPNHSPAGLLVSLPCSSDHFQVMRQGLQGRPMAEEGYCWSFSKATLLSELCLILQLRLLYTHTHTHPKRLLPHSRNR